MKTLRFVKVFNGLIHQFKGFVHGVIRPNVRTGQQRPEGNKEQ